MSTMLPILKQALRSNTRAGLLMGLFVLLAGGGFVQYYPTFKGISGFEEMLSNPLYRAILGEYVTEFFSSIKGFLAIEVFSMLWLYVGLFMAFFGANTVSREMEDKTIDLLLSYPIRRFKLVLVRWLGLMLYLILIMVIFWAGLSLGIQGIGEEIDATKLFYAVLGALGLFAAIGSYSVFMSCLFDAQRKAFAASFGLLIGTYILHSLTNVIDVLKPLKYFSPFNYYDSGKILIQGVFSWEDFSLLVGFSVFMLLLSAWWLERKDILI